MPPSRRRAERVSSEGVVIEGLLLSTVQEFATANTCCAAIMTRLLQVVALALLVVCVYAEVDIDTLSARVVRTRPAT